MRNPDSPEEIARRRFRQLRRCYPTVSDDAIAFVMGTERNPHIRRALADPDDFEERTDDGD